MKRSIVILLVGLFLLAGVLAKEANASWAALSTEEIIEKSDVVLIGEIIGPDREEKISTKGLPDSWATHWKVKVYYYLKGNQKAEVFTVTTPGAKNKSPQSSIDYRLDQFGKTVLIFLQNREGIFEPLSPQGIVVLKVNYYSPKQGEQINGQTVLNEFTIVNPQINDRSILEKYISDNQTILIPEHGMSDSYSNSGNSNKLKIITIVILIIALISTGSWFIVKQFQKG
ncbi:MULTISPECIES: hypothetical protein [Dehalobacter]|uniref:Uncharacterized protein n=2 Tax=Dehalobacter restrictus TaxID=55583 RepID=A0A857DH73_9FIRM|nr:MULTISPECIES: hypothetical protein [Dehalobacter]AHF11271.1 hypothetical protein DEHRE_03690 [Dehalobacter restrictus DSM 9455]MCG1025243.1 hypothetical protein [Dehalobacter sp.]MDJ0305834.1 hypothetical protein [Dehalobacter sp.]OCZ52284.1 hypothetical protein A7D23_10870 [Dehalobacter sp. TeCB1]QGZ99841.1 hypothetical protein GQ588_03855 [Dehalobacter restrictus]